MYTRRHSIVKTEEAKFSILDLNPHNIHTVDYCKSIINIRICGECENHSRSWSSSFFLNKENFTLASFLQSMDAFLRSFRDARDITGDEEEFVYYMQGLLEMRNIVNTQRFVADVRKFVEIYQKRNSVSERLNHTGYWGTHQQLLAGKVIADFVAEEYGPLDPIFGVLLSPVAGRVGPGDSGFVHDLLFDDNGPVAYHSAVHDAFGYLITYHKIGPGYNYTGAGTVLETSKCMSGQVSGIRFWHDILKTEQKKHMEITF